MDKIFEHTKEMIRCWYEAFDGHVYVAYSGGKDSSVLLHIVRSMYPEVPAVFVNTGLEFPEILRFVRQTDNVVTLIPKIPFFKVIEKYGYPVVSKEQAQFIRQYRTTNSDKLRDIRWNGNKWKRGKISECWKFMVDAPFKISEKCCDIMKKNPSIKYEKETGRKPFIGTMALESSKRVQNLNQHGCNAYDLKRPTSKPLSYWTTAGIWKYIKDHGLDYSTIYDMGYQRTGCMFCMFGVHIEHKERGTNRFIEMQKTHPKQWSYCMDRLGVRDVMNYIGVPCEATSA